MLNGYNSELVNIFMKLLTKREKKTYFWGTDLESLPRQKSVHNALLLVNYFSLSFLSINTYFVTYYPKDLLFDDKISSAEIFHSSITRHYHSHYCYHIECVLVLHLLAVKDIRMCALVIRWSLTWISHSKLLSSH